MLELEAAQERLLAAILPPTSERVSLRESAGRIVAQPLRARIHLPRFDNSAMDGYAVRAADTTSASANTPVALQLTGRVAAGEIFPGQLESGECVRVFTGSALPAGADAVVMQEDTRVDEGAESTIQILDAARPWENIRLQGEDIKQDRLLLQIGDSVSSGALNLLAATGCSEVPVGVRPVVGLLATGTELIEPGADLPPGAIYESNRVSLASLVQAAGGVVKIFPLVPDSLAATTTALKDALAECDLLVSTGGVSVGDLDFVKPALSALGARLDFWKVNIRPGRPFAFSQLGPKLVFGLPGNPVSAFVTFLLLVRPVIRRFQGANEVHLPQHPGRLGESIRNSGDRRHFVRVVVGQDGSVRSAGVQASHTLASLAVANGLLDLPPHAELPSGAAVQILRFDW